MSPFFPPKKPLNLVAILFADLACIWRRRGDPGSSFLTRPLKAFNARLHFRFQGQACPWSKAILPRSWSCDCYSPFSSAKAKIWIGCDCGGTYRHQLPRTGESKTRNTSSRLINCPFRLTDKQVSIDVQEKWKVIAVSDEHNHETNV
jgi:hypothetical protein